MKKLSFSMETETFRKKNSGTEISSKIALSFTLLGTALLNFIQINLSDYAMKCNYFLTLSPFKEQFKKLFERRFLS